MIDKFDYQEPRCLQCSGKDFYYPQKDAPLGTVPVDRVLSKVDGLFNKNDYKEAGRLLNYWRQEAVALKDKRGELALESELVGYYRKQGDRENGLSSIARALELTVELEQGEMVSGATVYINCATAYESFGMVQEALPLYLEAEAVYLKVLKPGDARFGGLYNNMALALVDLNRFDEAEAAYRNALGVMEQVEKGEAECAITYINMAYLYEASGRREMIGDCMEKAYKFLQSEKLPKDGYYAFVLEKCAPAFSYFGDEEVCAQMLKEAEEIYARS